MNIHDAVVLVTGANRGLGAALTVAALERGVRKIYAGSRDLEKLAPLVQRGKGRVVPIQLDITSRSSLAAAAAAAEDVTVLVNNAGVLASFNLLESTDDEIEREFTTNFFGTVAATKAFLPALARAGARGGAAIVNVLSVVSLASLPGLGAYSASKAASFSITQALRKDLTPKGISVIAALPGAIDTDMVRSFEMPKTAPDVIAKAILDGVTAGEEEIVTDPISREVFTRWKRDPKEAERFLAAM